MSHYGRGPAGTTEHVGDREDCPGPDCGPTGRDALGRFTSTKTARRGTTNGNARGSADDRRRRREWLVATYRADKDKPLWFGTMAGFGEAEYGQGIPACRCYRCGALLTADTVTVDRIIPGCQGGTYRRDNIRPACQGCNSRTGATMRRKK